jgi:hypothetical protein
MGTFTSGNPSIGNANYVFWGKALTIGPSNTSLYRNTILSNAKSSQGNNNMWSMFGRFSYGDIRYPIYYVYTWGNITYYQVTMIDVVNDYDEQTQNPNSNPGLRTIYNRSNSAFYTTLPLSLNGPWSAWGYGPYNSGNRFTSSNAFLVQAWTFECWVRPIYNSAGTIDPYIGQQLDFMYPTPYVVNATRVSYDSFETSQGCGFVYCQFGLLVDQYKVIITNSWDDGTFCVGKYYINFDTSKFYQIAVTFQNSSDGGRYTLFINGQQVYTVTPYSCYPGAIPWLDLSLLISGNPGLGLGGSNPFFVGWSSQFKAWLRPLQSYEILASYNYSAHRYGLSQNNNPANVCAYSTTYGMYTYHLFYNDGSVVDSGTNCAPMP